jgi:hypothetical protein
VLVGRHVDIRFALVVGLSLAALGGCSGDDSEGSAGTRTESPPDDGRAAATERASSSPAAGGTVYLGAQRGIPVPVVPFGDRLVRPSRLETSRDALATRMTWREWGNPVATGRGMVSINICEPNCARGRVVRRPGVQARLDELHDGECQGRAVRFYTRAVLEWPPGLGLPAREGFKLLPRCSEVD